jgi:hypothetical protein
MCVIMLEQNTGRVKSPRSTGHAFADIYFEDERSAAKLLTKDEARRTLRGLFFSQLSIMARACNSASLRNPMTTLPFISTPAG